MSRFNKGSREVPELSTSSLPDLIFTVLFFFMMVTSLREVTLMVKIERPAGTQLEKLARKSCTSFIYIGKPTDKYRSQMGASTRIQINDDFAESNEIYDFIMTDRNKMSESDKPFYTVSLKVDYQTPMGIITDVKQALRKAYALKIIYSATKPKKQ